jgi:hypothetical protein
LLKPLRQKLRRMQLSKRKPLRRWELAKKALGGAVRVKGAAGRCAEEQQFSQ